MEEGPEDGDAGDGDDGGSVATSSGVDEETLYARTRDTNHYMSIKVCALAGFRVAFCQGMIMHAACCRPQLIVERSSASLGL